METLIKRKNSNAYSDGLLATIFGGGTELVNNFQYSSEIEIFECLPENRLTEMSMHISEKSLKDVWKNEKDEVWDRY